MLESDADYFARRASEEEEASVAADTPEVAEIHRKLAHKYAAMAAKERDRREAAERWAPTASAQARLR